MLLGWILFISFQSSFDALIKQESTVSVARSILIAYVISLNVKYFVDLFLIINISFFKIKN